MFSRDEISDVCDRFKAYNLLTVEGLGLRWSKDSARILELAKQADEDDVKLFRRNLIDEGNPFLPLYYSVDDGEISGAYCRNPPQLVPALLGLADLIAENLCSEANWTFENYGATWNQCLHGFGGALVEVADPILRQALAGIEPRYARYEWDPSEHQPLEPPYDKSFTAPIDSEDGNLVENGWRWCNEGDENASLIFHSSFECADADFSDLLTDRVSLAERVLRGQISIDQQNFSA